MSKKKKKKQLKSVVMQSQKKHKLKKDASIVDLIREERAKTGASLKKALSANSQKTVATPKKVIGTNESEILSPAEKPRSRLKRYAGDVLSKYGALFKFLRRLILVFVLIGMLIAAAAFAVWWQFGRDLPDVRELATHQFAQTTTIYDREGNVLYRIYGEENRTYVPLKAISKTVIDATIAIEDQNFYQHFGFDPMGILRAQMHNLQEEDIVQGASTITQQLAKNLYLKPDKTVDRKIKELILSLQIEWYYDKDQILELYFNKIPYGSNAFGIEAASKTFFGKASADLTLAEASVLAALPKAPSYFSPYGTHKDELMGHCNTESCSSPYDENYVWGRKDLVLAKMVEDGRITQHDFEQAWTEAVDLSFKDLKHEIKSPHFVFFVRDFLEQKYGKEMVESGGLEVKTSLDPKMQKIAEDLVAEYVEKGQFKKSGSNNAALVAIEPASGGVLAMIGSLDYWNPEIDGQVNVTTSLRQMGSAFKPLVYGAAVKYAGLGTGTFLGDYRTKFEGNYVPNNSDNAFRGRMNLRTALNLSRNIPAIKAFYIVGEEKILEFLESVGVTSLSDFKKRYNSNPDRKWDFKYGGAMAIGSGEMKLIELAGSFAAYANKGKFNPVNPILEIRNSDGELIYQFEDKGVQVMDAQVAFIINNMLSDVYAKPAGTWRNVLTLPDRPVAAKTGTSNKKVGRINLPNNLLTIGYTPSLVAAVWVGNTDGTQLYGNAWGFTDAAPLWNDFMKKSLEGKAIEEFEKPEGLIEKGGQFFPAWWDAKKNFDVQFRPLEKKDCTDEERKKDPTICKSKEEMEKEKEAKEKAEAEARLKEENSGFGEPGAVPEKPRNNDTPSEKPVNNSSPATVDELPPATATTDSDTSASTDAAPEKPLNTNEKEDTVLTD